MKLVTLAAVSMGAVTGAGLGSRLAADGPKAFSPANIDRSEASGAAGVLALYGVGGTLATTFTARVLLPGRPGAAAAGAALGAALGSALTSSMVVEAGRD